MLFNWKVVGGGGGFALCVPMVNALTQVVTFCSAYAFLGERYERPVRVALGGVLVVAGVGCCTYDTVVAAATANP